MPTEANHDLKNYAYQTLKERLINCVYEPGSLLKEGQLAEELDLSRTPIREALNRLETDGFVKILPKKGIYVPEIQLSDILQIFQARIEVEPITLKMAAPHLPGEELLRFRDAFSSGSPRPKDILKLDMAMHLFFIEHCGNYYLIDMMHRLFDNNTKFFIASRQESLDMSTCCQEHMDIITLLLEKNYEKAQALLHNHIARSRQNTLDFLTFRDAYFTSPAAAYKKSTTSR